MANRKHLVESPHTEKGQEECDTGTGTIKSKKRNPAQKENHSKIEIFLSGGVTERREKG